MTVKFLISYSTRPAADLRPARHRRWGRSAALIVLYLAYVRLFTTQAIGDRPLLLLGILLIFTGVQLVTLGLLAEMQARTYHESQDKPTYVIKEIRHSASREPANDEALSASSGSADRRRAAGADPAITDIQKEFGASRSRRQRYADS